MSRRGGRGKSPGRLMYHATRETLIPHVTRKDCKMTRTIIEAPRTDEERPNVAGVFVCLVVALGALYGVAFLVIYALLAYFGG